MAQIRLSEQAIESLKCHSWPGNVRELENTIARACALSSTDLLLPEDIPFTKGAFKESAKIQEAIQSLLKNAPKDGRNIIKWTEELFINEVLSESEGDMKEAARVLGLSISELKALNAKS